MSKKITTKKQVDDWARVQSPRAFQPLAKVTEFVLKKAVAAHRGGAKHAIVGLHVGALVQKLGITSSQASYALRLLRAQKLIDAVKQRQDRRNGQFLISRYNADQLVLRFEPVMADPDLEPVVAPVKVRTDKKTLDQAREAADAAAYEADQALLKFGKAKLDPEVVAEVVAKLEELRADAQAEAQLEYDNQELLESADDHQQIGIVPGIADDIEDYLDLTLFQWPSTEEDAVPAVEKEAAHG